MSFPDKAVIYQIIETPNFKSELLKGKAMHEVKVFDGSGNLKKVISVKTLNKRTEKQINSPSFYNKKGRKVKPSYKKDLNNENSVL